MIIWGETVRGGRVRPNASRFTTFHPFSPILTNYCHVTKNCQIVFLLFLKSPALYTILLEITAWVDLVKVWSILPLTCGREVKKTPNLTSLGFSVLLHFSVSCFWNSGCQHRAQLDGAGPWWNGCSPSIFLSCSCSWSWMPILCWDRWSRLLPPHTNLRLSVSGCPSVRTLSPPRHNSPGPSVVHPPTCIHRIFNSDPRAIDLKSASLQSTYAKKLAALCSTVVCQSCQHIFQQFCAQLDNFVYSKPKIFLSHRAK